MEIYYKFGSLSSEVKLIREAVLRREGSPEGNVKARI
jgi:hypothetical protein